MTENTENFTFKAGDKVRVKDRPEHERTVLAVVVSPHTGRTHLVLWGETRDVFSWDASHYELVPDPMVARREAYIAWASLCLIGDYELYFKLVREGKQDKVVNRYYDAIVATKHLFT